MKETTKVNIVTGFIMGLVLIAIPVLFYLFFAFIYWIANDPLHIIK